jgi:Bacterial capsule synthesis protein PGA_cap
MSRGVYSVDYRRPRSHKRRYIVFLVLVAALLAIAGASVRKNVQEDPAARVVSKLRFDASVNKIEEQIITKAIATQNKTPKNSINIHINTVLESTNNLHTLAVYVPVTGLYSTRQETSIAELANSSVYVPSVTDNKTRSAIVELLGIKADQLKTMSSPTIDIGSTDIALIPIDQLSNKVKLLTFEGSYYLDSFQKGAIFRQVEFSGQGKSELSNLKLNDYLAKGTVLKVNMTGVTALTRLMMKKLNTVKDPLYFSAKIGDFLADADITHVSNEVSFMEGCQYSHTVFCAPLEYIETLKASGVDVVELTGNHNNDSGSRYNTDTINLYHSLGWGTFGGGLNSMEAAIPYYVEKKGSMLTFLGYNYPDSPSGGPIAAESKAGANSFDFEKIKKDIESAKKKSHYVIVDVQFWECYAYPDGYIEFPECDTPIANQKEVFRKITDLGADMVVGTQAHQPQTFEIYNSKPIYYGLGNLYFEQTQWPGTERGIILTHYFSRGELLQTKLSPTVYDSALQTRLMTNVDAVKLLKRLEVARQASGL